MSKPMRNKPVSRPNKADEPARAQAARRAVKQAVKRQRATPQMARAIPFARFCVLAGLPEPVTEHRFHPPRRWRFDYAWPDVRLALEVEGGVWTGGRHTRGSGFLGDVEKYNTATVNGWRVLRCTPDTLHGEETVAYLRDAFRLLQEVA